MDSYPWRNVDLHISIGPISGMVEVAREAVLHLGVHPDAHPGLLIEVQQAIGEEILDTVRAVLAERGIAVPEIPELV